MYFGAIVQAVSFLICYFFMEETMYFRKTIEGEEVSNKKSDEAEEVQAGSEKTPVSESQALDQETGQATESRQTAGNAKELTWSSYRKKLSLFVKMEGRPSNKAMSTMMWRPLPLIHHFPCVSWAGL